MAEMPAKRPRRERSRSRERAPRDRDHERDRGTRDRSIEREYSRRDRDRSRSRDQKRLSRDHPIPRSERPLRRSRSPRRHGEGTSTRIRSPVRPKRERDDERPASSSSIKLVPSKAPTKSEPPKNTKLIKIDVDPNAHPEDVALRKMMGFTSFKTTQNTKVPGNQIYGVRKEKKTEYRQYMNRVGGFNRPLSPGR